MEHRFRVTKALAGYLSFKVLDAYLGGRVPGREPEAGEIGDEATLAVRRRLQVEGERWRRETDPARRKFRKAAFGASKARAREAISSEGAVARSSALAEAAAIGVVARCGRSGMALTLASGVATLAEVGTGLRHITTLSGPAPTRRSARRQRRTRQRAAQQAQSFGVRLERRPNLGPLQPARPGFAAEEATAMLAAARRFVSDHRARGVTKVFYVERLEGQDFMRASREELEAVSCQRVQDGQLRPYSLKLGCECKFCLSQRAIAQWKGNPAHTPLDLTVRGVLERVEMTAQVAAGFQA
eukprot:COSAG01_NODE_13149_length_1628_cov_2.449313_2_plen_299_part_00